MEIPQRLLQFLNQSQVKYQILHHPEAFTAQELAAIEHVKGKNHAKVVMATAAGKPVMLVLPATHRVDLDQLSTLAGKPATLATEAQFKELFPDCAVGTMPPFGHLYGVPTYIERSLTEDTLVVFEAGTHSDAIKMNCADYARLAKGTVGDFAIRLH
jgi:Ala-tRNA(Pro) deacylase